MKDPLKKRALARDLEYLLSAAISSWEEERARALRESCRVTDMRLRLNEACELLSEAHSHVRNMPLADDIAKFLCANTTPVTPANLPQQIEAKTDYFYKGH